MSKLSEDIHHRLPNGQPLSCRTVAEREYLRREVVLLELAPLAQVPRPDGVVEAARPQLVTLRRDVDAAGAVRVALKLSEADRIFIVSVSFPDVKTARFSVCRL